MRTRWEGAAGGGGWGERGRDGAVCVLVGAAY
jgi:hypothetical protein